jgi:3-methyladenine DNA glycosylase Tag
MHGMKYHTKFWQENLKKERTWKTLRVETGYEGLQWIQVAQDRDKLPS